MKRTIKQLKIEEQKIREEINNIKDREIEENQIPFLKSLVGKYFVYHRNCYSCPKTKSDYWDVFRKIIDFIYTKEGGWYFLYQELSVDSQGKASWTIDSHSAHLNKEWWGLVPFSGFIKSTENDWDCEYDYFIDEIIKQKKMRKFLSKKY